MNDQAVNPFAPTTNMVERKTNSTAVAQTDQQRAVAEVQAAMMIARMNPRDPIAAMDRILNACSRPTLADSAVYTYSRGGSDVTGPSIRLAEAMAQSWGNMQFGIRELEQRNGESTVQAFAWDVETNTRREVTFQVPHIRHTRSGARRLEDPRDIYEMVANQGSRRLRACILAIIPGDVTEAAVKQCEVTMHTSADTSPDTIAKMVQAFAQYGVTREHIEARIQRRLDAIQPAQVVGLKKIFASLRDGMSAPADWFPVGEPLAAASPTDGASRTDAVREKLRAKKAKDAGVNTDTGEVSRDDTPAVTYAYVADVINRATTADDLDVAADLISSVKDEQQRAELDVMAREKRGGMQG